LRSQCGDVIAALRAPTIATIQPENLAPTSAIRAPPASPPPKQTAGQKIECSKLDHFQRSAELGDHFG